MINLSNFFAIGINYKKTDASVRGLFAIGPDQYAAILQKAHTLSIKELVVLSTCNRTEIYGIANQASDLINLLCSETTGSKEVFLERCYLKKEKEAVTHIFSVGAGLDSQILGDYEIVGQMKLAVKFAKDRGFVGSFLERLFNTVLQSSKTIKNQTALSGGTVSVSFAAIQYLKEHLPSIPQKNMLLIGTGKIGKNTCKNLIDYLDTTNITLINRTNEKAAELAAELGIGSATYQTLPVLAEKADVIIVATNAEAPILYKENFIQSGKKILIDLSIPHNIHPDTAQLAHISLVNVDDLAKINDATLQKRQAEIPKVLNIIQEFETEFFEWLDSRKFVPVIKAVKKKLEDMNHCEMFNAVYIANSHSTNADDAVQKAVKNMAVKLRNNYKPGCNFIEAINDFITISSN
ncbi:glutamyl-tRNA reductase [Hydrotalea sp.]|uniref:glutamyl-tRNA reductase n=1 Tax=Hydrotalea sp. TaxID=2881279 RepID=UPI002608216E|nr:glutamyl-tRNA reductase [Hydrotalea sp.]